MYPDARPSQGDWSVCIHCGAPLEFVHDKWEARKDDQIPNQILADVLKHRRVIKHKRRRLNQKMKKHQWMLNLNISKD